MQLPSGEQDAGEVSAEGKDARLRSFAASLAARLSGLDAIGARRCLTEQRQAISTEVIYLSPPARPERRCARVGAS